MCALMRFFACNRYIDFFLPLFYCIVGCLGMIVWTHAVWGVLQACVLYFLLALVQRS